MEKTLAAFARLTNAEDYFHFLEVPFDPQVVNVYRLHILRQFALFKESIDQETEDPQIRLARYRQALERAYRVFLTSCAQEQKLFKVFQTPPPNVVLLSDLLEES
ncbi:MAG: nitrogenase-stabilizing/protective protein NifW [Gloeomargarita sp. GMQP_bins_120]